MSEIKSHNPMDYIGVKILNCVNKKHFVIFRIFEKVIYLFRYVNVQSDNEYV